MSLYPQRSRDSAAPGADCATVVPSDNPLNDFLVLAAAIYVGGTGNVALVTENGVAVVWPSCPAGMLIPCRCRRINATGTTASGLVAVF